MNRSLDQMTGDGCLTLDRVANVDLHGKVLCWGVGPGGSVAVLTGQVVTQPKARLPRDPVIALGSKPRLVFIAPDGAAREIVLTARSMVYRWAQPLPSGGFVLVGEDPDPGGDGVPGHRRHLAFVHDSEGACIHQFLLSDDPHPVIYPADGADILDVQAGSDGNVWVSYDEGVGGGLACWSLNGESVWSWSDQVEESRVTKRLRWLPFISWTVDTLPPVYWACGLNVDPDDVTWAWQESWLARVQDGGVERFTLPMLEEDEEDREWTFAAMMGRAFAVAPPYVLAAVGHTWDIKGPPQVQTRPEQEPTALWALLLRAVDDGTIEPIKPVRIEWEGCAFPSMGVRCRGSAVVASHRDDDGSLSVYSGDIRALVRLGDVCY